MRTWEEGFESDYWLTFKQAQSLGGQVRKGEKGSLVTFWKLYTTQDKATGEELNVPVLRHYTAFNATQVDGLQPPDKVPNEPQKVFTPIARAQAIVDGYQAGPTTVHRGSLASYRPSEDQVQIPGPNRFETPESYYSTLFHELSHSTGHSSRLDRGLDRDPKPFGSPDYSREELVAELSAAFLCATAGISPPVIEQSAAYLDGWIKVLKGDHRLVVAAAGAAQKSADRILADLDAQTGPLQALPMSPP